MKTLKITNIKSMRLSSGLSQKEAAEKVGVTSASLCLLEKKGCYDTRTAAKYAAAYNCHPLRLLDGLPEN